MVAAVEACDYYVRLSPLFDAYSTVGSGQDKGFTVFADLVFVLFGESDFGCHGYSSGYVYVALGECWVFVLGFFG